MHATRTLQLDDHWDIQLNEAGKIKTTAKATALATAQAAANECRRFLADSYFDHDVGLPHFQVELGQTFGAGAPAQKLRSHLRRAAL
ncbi:MAG: hypothetical protein LBS31_03205, partial [Candidatus Adiutrix sp.]|nr:hypothetical protein [Candidatus Adiutrix sp.]